jgi:hypothetical protein
MLSNCSQLFSQPISKAALVMAPTQTPIQNDAKPDLGPPLSAFAIVLLLQFIAYFWISSVQDQKILLLVTCLTMIILYSHIVYNVNFTDGQPKKHYLPIRRKFIIGAISYPMIYVFLLFLHFYTPLMGFDVSKPASMLLMFMVFHRMGTASERRKYKLGTKTDIGTSTSEMK